MIPRRAAIVLAMSIATTGTSARAETERYGGEMLGTEAVGWTLAAAGAKFKVRPVTIAGLGIVLLGPPSVHLLLHDSPGRAGISLAMRAGAPIAGLAIGGLIDPCRGDSCFPAGPVIGALAGYVGAVVIDVVVLAKVDTQDMPVARIFSITGAF